MTVPELVAENVVLREQNAQLSATVSQLRQQVDWFTRQLFGQKSEKHLSIDPAIQPSLLAGLVDDVPAVTPPTHKVSGHTRKAKTRDGCVTDQGLRFDERVPVKEITFMPDELKGPDAGDYEILRYDEVHRLAQRPGSHVVLRLRTPVFRHKTADTLQSRPLPASVLPGSIADVSLLAGLLTDKFLYHLPLYRQHQRLADAGIQLSRATLTHLSARAIRLLAPIAEAQFRHTLQSRVIAVDETPIKAGKQEGGKLQQGYVWPVYGDDNEVSFRFHPGRSGKHLQQVLEGFTGTLVTDGYEAYARYAANKPGITHAQCWAHARRTFEQSLAYEPLASEALQFIGTLYQNEQVIRDKSLAGEAKQQHRLNHSKPVLDTFWQWCDQQCRRPDLTPQGPFAKALKYVMGRQPSLQVFLSDPDVPIDTNHLERALRPIPMGRKNWLFCWSEAGARDVATIQSLLVTCRLQGVDPYTYLIDVLQRVIEHPDSRVIELTPREWKTRFADNPMRSLLDSP